MTILLWGPKADGPLAAVAASLGRRGEDVFHLDQADTLTATLEMAVDRSVTGRLTVGGASLALESVRAVYTRLDDALALSRARSEVEIRHVRAFEAVLSSWLEITPARVVNRPTAMASNASKPYQAGLIRAAGFDTPATLLTTDKDAVLAFRQAYGAIVYKSTSGVRSIVARLSQDMDDRLDNALACPVQFQELVPGTDVRVHVVGEALFAAEIVSTADDYRYARAWETRPQIRACAAPADLAGRCRVLTARLGLEASGIDLRRRPDGRWCCFEVNPSPGFTFFEQACGMPIAEAFADLLAGDQKSTATPLRSQSP